MAPFGQNTGPYAVGAADLSTACTTCADEEVSGRLFYPTANLATPAWPVTWVGQYEYAQGYARYATIRQPDTIKRTLLRGVLSGLLYLMGATQRLRVRFDAPLAPLGAGQAHPVVLFSHGIAGTRNTYSSLCTDLASQGYVVLAVEHADGTASTALQAPQQGQRKPRWLFYAGWGEKDAQARKIQLRVLELRTGLRLLRHLDTGGDLAPLHLSGGAVTAQSFQGQLDVGRVGVVGHSYGGATAAAAASEFAEFGCAVALDPWWGALPADSCALSGWRTGSPMLVIGSHDWNKPFTNSAGAEVLKCDGVRQKQVLQAASAHVAPHAAVTPAGEVLVNTSGGGSGAASSGSAATAASSGSGGVAAGSGAGGGGAILLVPSGSTHGSFDDIMLLFGTRFRFLLERLMGPSLGHPHSPETYHRLNVWSIDHFMRTSLGGGVGFSGAAGGDGVGRDQGAARLGQTSVPRPERVVAEHRDAYAAQYGEVAAILQVYP